MATWSGVIVPVLEADPVVGEWLRWDPAAWLGVPAHVTLLAPFVRPPAPAETVDRLATLLGGTAPWTARFSALAEFPGGVLYLAPDDPAPFVALTAALAAAWPEHPPYGGAFDTVVPHLTVCEGAPPATRAAAAAAVAPALPLTAEVHEAWLMEQPEPGAPYALRAHLPFG